MHYLLLFILSISARGQKTSVLFQDDFEGTSLSWSITGGEWEWGTPQGLGGSSHGNPDPSSAYSGTKVIGTDLSGDGDYSANAECYITSPPIDCSGYIGVTLSFYRWLNVERSRYDQAKVEVSNDGNTWTTLWENPDNETTDNSWVYQEFDISSVADNQPTVYIRFTLTSDGSWQYSGWNIDDVVVTGNNEPDIRLESYSPKSADPGDSNVPLTIYIKNYGTDATGVSCTLSSLDSYITVSNTNNPFNAGNLAYQATLSNSATPFYFNVSSDCPDGHDAKLLLDVEADGGYNRQDTINIHIGKAEWTFMVYINGDNNLSSYGDDDRQEMEAVGSNPSVNIVVQQDWSTSYGGDDGTVRWYINQGSSDTVMALPEQDMGIPSTLIDFANWTIDNYPAKHYALIIWDHGSGWDKRVFNPVDKGFSWDDESGNHFSVAGGDLDTALYYIKQHLGRNLDVLGFDACLMATFEVADVARKYVDYLVFSEKTEPGDGWPYDDILDTLAQNPYITPYEFAGEIAKRYITSYSGGSQGSQDATQSAIKLGGEDFHKLLVQLDHLSQELIDAGGKSDSDISGARGNTIEMDDGTSTLVDLYDAVEDIKIENINSTINALCDSVKFYIGRVVIYHGYNDAGSSNGWNQTHGLSIYYPDRNTSVSSSYANFDFAHNNTWYDFISGVSSTANISSVIMHLADYTYDDMYNHNGTIGQGESVLLYPIIENSGSNTAQGVVLHLDTDDPNVTIDDSIITVGDIPSFTIVDPGTSVKFTVSNSVPLNTNVVVKVILTSTNKATQNIDYLTFTVGEPLSVEENKSHVISGESRSFIASSKFIYRIPPSNMPVLVNLFSVDGRKVRELYTGKTETVREVYVSNLKPGMYFIVERRGNTTNKTRLLVIR